MVFLFLSRSSQQHLHNVRADRGGFGGRLSRSACHHRP